MDMVLTYWHWFIGALLLALALALGVSWLALSGHPHHPRLAHRGPAAVRKQGGARS